MDAVSLRFRTAVRLPQALSQAHFVVGAVLFMWLSLPFGLIGGDASGHHHDLAHHASLSMAQDVTVVHPRARRTLSVAQVDPQP